MRQVRRTASRKRESGSLSSPEGPGNEPLCSERLLLLRLGRLVLRGRLGHCLDGRGDHARNRTVPVELIRWCQHSALRARVATEFGGVVREGALVGRGVVRPAHRTGTVRLVHRHGRCAGRSRKDTASTREGGRSIGRRCIRSGRRFHAASSGGRTRKNERSGERHRHCNAECGCANSTSQSICKHGFSLVRNFASPVTMRQLVLTST